MTINPKVIDLYHENEEPDWELAYKSGIRGVIHKATEGGFDVDSKYAEREQRARSAGLLWGAYHFIRPWDPGQQAEHFCNAIGRDTLPVLDHEDRNVPLWAALRWLQLVRKILGHAPVLYTGFLIREQEDNRHMPAFSEFPLWLAEYGPVAKVPLPWTKCLFWQYTDGKVGPEPHRIDGVPEGVDVSSFDGTDDELKAAW